MFLSLLAVLPESIPGCINYYSQEGSYGLDSYGEQHIVENGEVVMKIHSGISNNIWLFFKFFKICTMKDFP